MKLETHHVNDLCIITGVYTATLSSTVLDETWFMIIIDFDRYFLSYFKF